MKIDILTQNLPLYFEDAIVDVDDINKSTAVLNMLESKLNAAYHELNPYQTPEVEKSYLLTNGYPKTCDEWVKIQSLVFKNFPELPPNWIRIVSKSHGGTYYYNTSTFVSTTELPGSKVFGEQPQHEQER